MEGLRSLADVRLRLEGLTVLIGDNGSGKSRLIEACAAAATRGRESFSEDLNKIHGGVGSPLRAGAEHLKIGLAIGLDDSHDHRVEHAPTLTRSGTVSSERLDAFTWDEDTEDAEKRERVLVRPHDDHDSPLFKFLTDSSDGSYIERDIDSKRTALSSALRLKRVEAIQAIVKALITLVRGGDGGL